MNNLQRALIASSLLAIGACGTSKNSAPIVYGTDASQQARIYNSPQDIYRKQRAAQNPYATQNPYEKQNPYATRNPYASRAPAPRRTATRAPTAYVQPARLEPVQLAPVAAVYQPEPVRFETKAPARRSGYVEVQPGDTVYAVGRRFNVSPQAIIAENRLAPPYALAIGQALKLPAGATAKRSTLTQPAAPARRVVAQDTIYTVQAGDTLYAISRATQVPVQTIVQANGLAIPYNIDVGQRILVPQARTSDFTTPSARTARLDRESGAPRPSSPRSVADIARKASYTAPAAREPSSYFQWPVRGAIISEYGAGALGRRNEGVNIAAPAGTPVRAAADGEIVYRGSELDGYGNLLLLKHDDGFVTAYAHNDAMLVRKGQKVRQGQVIAKVGQTGSVGSPQLHFEIRQNLKSVDPGALLGSQ